MSGNGNNEVELKVGYDFAKLNQESKKLEGEIRKQVKDVKVDVKPEVENRSLIALAKTLNVSFSAVQKFTESLQLTGTAANSAFNRLKELKSVGASSTDTFKALNAEFGLSENQVRGLSNAYKGLQDREQAAAQSAADQAAAQKKAAQENAAAQQATKTASNDRKSQDTAAKLNSQQAIAQTRAGADVEKANQRTAQEQIKSQTTLGKAAEQRATAEIKASSEVEKANQRTAQEQIKSQTTLGKAAEQRATAEIKASSEVEKANQRTAQEQIKSQTTLGKAAEQRATAEIKASSEVEKANQRTAQEQIKSQTTLGKAAEQRATAEIKASSEVEKANQRTAQEQIKSQTTLGKAAEQRATAEIKASSEIEKANQRTAQEQIKSQTTLGKAAEQRATAEIKASSEIEKANQRTAQEQIKSQTTLGKAAEQRATAEVKASSEIERANQRTAQEQIKSQTTLGKAAEQRATAEIKASSEVEKANQRTAQEQIKSQTTLGKAAEQRATAEIKASSEVEKANQRTAQEQIKSQTTLGKAAEQRATAEIKASSEIEKANQRTAQEQIKSQTTLGKAAEQRATAEIKASSEIEKANQRTAQEQIKSQTTLGKAAEQRATAEIKASSEIEKANQRTAQEQIKSQTTLGKAAEQRATAEIKASSEVEKANQRTAQEQIKSQTTLGKAAEQRATAEVKASSEVEKANQRTAQEQIKSQTTLGKAAEQRATAEIKATATISTAKERTAQEELRTNAKLQQAEARLQEARIKGEYALEQIRLRQAAKASKPVQEIDRRQVKVDYKAATVPVAIAPKIESKALVDLSKTLGGNIGSAKAFADSLNITGSAAKEALARMQALAAAGATTAEKYTALSREFGLNAKQISTLSQAANGLSAKQAAIATSSGNASAEVTKLARSFGGTYSQALQLSQGLGLTAREARVAITQLQQLKGSGATSAQAFTTLRSELGLTADQFHKLETVAGQAKNTLSGLNGIVTGVAQGIAQAGTQAAVNALQGAVSGIEGAIATSVGTFADYQFALTDFASKAQVPVDSLDSLEAEIREIAKTSTKAPPELAETASMLVSMGRSAKQAEEELRPITLLADSLGGDVKVVGRVVTQTVSIFEDFGETAETAADKIQYFIDTTAIGSTGGPREFEKLLAQAGPSAKKAGIGFEELASAFATLRASGFSDRVAATSIKTSLLALSGPTDKAAVELRKIGVEAFDAQGKFKGLAQVYTDFAAALQGKSQQEQLRFATLVFGREGASGFLEMMDKVGTKFIDTLNGARANASGAVERRAALLNGTLTRLGENFKGSIETLINDVGAALEPFLSGILNIANQVGQQLVDRGSFDDLTDAATRFGNALKDDPKLIANITENCLRLIDIIDEVGASVVDTISAFAQGESPGETIQSLISFLEALSNTIKGLSATVQISFAILDPFISPTIELFGTLYQAVNAVGDAIAALVDKFGGLGAIIERIPLIGTFIESKRAADDLAPSVDEAQKAFRQRQAFSGSGGGREGFDTQSEEGGLEADINPDDMSSPTAEEDKQLAALEVEAKQREAVLRASGKSEVEIEQSIADQEQEILDRRIGLNEQKLQKLKEAKEGTSDPGEIAELEKEILQVEGTIADDRLEVQQELADERERVERVALEKIEKANADADARITQSQSARAAAIRQRQLAGQLSEEEASEAIAKIQADSINETIAAKRQELTSIQQLRQAGTISAEEAAERERDLVTEIGQLNVQALEEQIQAQEEQKKRRLEDLEEISKAEQRTIEKGKNERAIAIREQQLAGGLSEDQADDALVKSEQQASDEILALKTAELQQVQELRNQGIRSAEEFAEREAQLQGEIENATLSRIESEIDARERAAETAKQQAEEELKQAKLVADTRARLEQAAFDRKTQAVEQQNNLLSAQAGLVSALAELQNSGTEAQIAQAEASGDTARAAQLRLDLLGQQQQQLIQQQAIEAQQLALSQQQARLELEREIRLSRQRELELELEISQARRTGATQAELDNLQAQLSIQQSLTQDTQRSRSTLDQTQAIQRSAQAASQQAAVNNLNTSQIGTIRQLGEEGGFTREMRDRINQLSSATTSASMLPPNIAQARLPAPLAPQLSMPNPGARAIAPKNDPQMQDLGTAVELLRSIDGLLRDGAATTEITNKIEVNGVSDPRLAAAQTAEAIAKQGMRRKGR
ncbi:hypothetical protein [Leptolyngbya sp. FACHB-16]|uniref:hypothetical protein n=1 Tax=unclassified Leptolyngbya TaxID=2650499 RepID=UPI001687425C|nr:hypothetical protein [Leptolyngbya sp. FACHB-16]MBD2156242.1 hypothetical protein [Leptolyngbya sp. FACHB-16]